MTVIAANPARADVNYRDGLHVLSDVWSGGCTVNFSVDRTAGSEFATNMVESLSAIAKVTGLQFNQVSPDDDRAAIRYTVGDTQIDNAAGLAATDGTITLLDAAKMPNAGNAKLNDGFRDRVVAHETLHALGLDHDADTGAGKPDELMNPKQGFEPLKFGKGDIAGMKYIRDVNDCTPPAPGTPAPAPSVDPSIASDPQVVIVNVDAKSPTSAKDAAPAVTIQTIASGTGCASVTVRSADGTAPACTPARDDDSTAKKPAKGGTTTPTPTTPAPTTTIPPKRGDATPTTQPPAPQTQTPPKRGEDSQSKPGKGGTTTPAPQAPAPQAPQTQTPPKRGEDSQAPRRETQAPAPQAPAPQAQAPQAPAPAPQAPKRETQAPAPQAPAPAPAAAAPAPAPAAAAPAPAPRRESSEGSGDRQHRDSEGH